ncbi:MAG TPA: ABC transporter ATP-binding protein, partial [Anaerolineae bacterium]
MAGVNYDHVTKQFGEVKAVNNLSVQVEDKEFLVLVGPSGCGKTTALRLLAGLEEVTEGEIKIGDRVVNDVAPKDRDIAMVFQSYALYPHMSVYDNMAFGLRLRKTPKSEIDRRVKEAADILG